MAATRCELCGGEEWAAHLPRVRDYISDEIFAVRRCVSCGLYETDPIPSDEAMGRYYPPRYRTDRQKYTGQLRVKLRANYVERQFPRGFRGRVLDVGCGTGAFALEMKRRGWEVAVTEINDAVLEDMRNEGMEAKRPDEAERDGFSAPFDAIVAWHVLEHVPHPAKLSAWARHQLKADGIFEVTVPNLASWQARMFGEDWLHLDVPRHVYHFTPDTLSRVVRDAGFEIVNTTTFAFEHDLFGWLQSALNRVCSRPNVLFEELTKREHQRTPLPRGDVVLSFALSPLLATWVVPMTVFSYFARRGATLTVTCKPSR